MAAVAIIKEAEVSESEALYRAISQSGKTQAVGKTAGEALDALTAQLEELNAARWL